MKLDEYEITEHISSASGVIPVIVLGVKMWSINSSLVILQSGKRIAICIDDMIGDYFYPDLNRINSSSMEWARTKALVLLPFESEEIAEQFCIVEL